MATRQLNRCSIPPEVVDKLAEHHIFTVKDFLERTKWDLMEILDIGIHGVDSLVATVSAAIAPTPTNAWGLWSAHHTSQGHLRTLIPPLDAALGGGLPPGTVTEIVGPAGLGKTQFCLGMCVVGCLDRLRENGRVLYIDTERKFSGERLAEIARTRFPECFLERGSMEAMLQRVIIKVPNSAVELLQILQGLQSAIIELKITLIIIDSIAALARADFGAQHIIERQKLLGQQASLLKLMAESFKIPVLVTNQVTTRISRQSNEEKGILVAALGPMWAHAVNTRLSLSTVKSQEEHPRHHPQTDSKGYRVINVSKSSVSPNISIPYIITGCGIQWDDLGVAPRQDVARNVLDTTLRGTI